MIGQAETNWPPMDRFSLPVESFHEVSRGRAELGGDMLEQGVPGRSVESLIAEERRHSHDYGGRSVFGWEPPRFTPV